jgi:hypothetical protein
MLREIIKRDTLPDYQFEEVGDDIIRVAPRRLIDDGPQLPPLPSDVLEEGRAIVPGMDIHALEAEWRAWWAASGRPKLRSPGRAFLGWVRTKR